MFWGRKVDRLLRGTGWKNAMDRWTNTRVE